MKTDIISMFAINEFTRLYHLILTNIFCFIHKPFSCKMKHLIVDGNDKVLLIGKQLKTTQHRILCVCFFSA